MVSGKEQMCFPFLFLLLWAIHVPGESTGKALPQGQASSFVGYLLLTLLPRLQITVERERTGNLQHISECPFQHVWHSVTSLHNFCQTFNVYLVWFWTTCFAFFPLHERTLAFHYCDGLKTSQLKFLSVWLMPYSYTNVNTGFSLNFFFLSLVFALLMYFLGSTSVISQFIFVS